MRTILAIVFAGLMSGCVVYEDEHGRTHVHPAVGVAVTVPVSHYHDASCGHYYYHDHWYHVERHTHGPKCGHVFMNGRWVLVL